MMHHKLGIGDLLVSQHKPVTFTCYGLGSCIGLFLQDRTLGLSGGAHIQLPSNCSSLKSIDKYYTVNSSIEQLLTQFKSKGSTTLNLRAKIVGGASMFSSTYQTGKKNADDTIDHLTKNCVFIAAADVGGKLSRTAYFDCHTGTMTVRNPETNEIKTY